MNKYQNEFPNYKLKTRLGSGDSGEVFLAEDKVLDRQVAIKIYNSNPIYDTTHIQDFKEQVKKIAALDHGNIAQIYYSGFLTDHTPYAIFEYVNGCSVKNYIAAHPWEKGSVFHQIINGMNHAHHKGIIHGDLHEENVLVDEKGIVKIIDFFGLYASNSPYSKENKLLSLGYSLVEDSELVSLLDQTIVEKFKPTSTWVILEELEFLEDSLDDYRNHIHVDDVAYTRYFIIDWPKYIAKFPIFKIEKIFEYITSPSNDESCMDICVYVKSDEFLESLKTCMNLQISKFEIENMIMPLLTKVTGINDIIDFYTIYQKIVLDVVYKEYFE